MAVNVGDASATTTSSKSSAHQWRHSSSCSSGSGASSNASVAGSPSGHRDDESVDTDANDDDDAPRSARSDASSRSSGTAAAAIAAAAARETQLVLPLDKEFVPLVHHDDDDREREAIAAPDEMRDDVIRMIFDLPDTTTFYQDYSCSIAGTFAMHGRMYPTSSHVCFYSNVFGRERKILIPYESIATIDKASTMVFQHAIRLATTASDEFTFTSFWGAHRDACYDLIVKTRRRVVHELASTPTEADAAQADTVAAQTVETNGGDLDDTDRALHEGTAAPSDSDSDQPTASPLPLSEELDREHSGRDDGGAVEDDASSPLQSPARERRVSVSAVSDIGAPAPRDISMTQLVDATFDVSVDAFLHEFVWDNARFGLDAFGAQQGYTEMKVNPWVTPLADDSAIGRTRSLQFRVPVDAPIGPKSSHVDVLQCASTDARGVYVIETSTRLVDIPYGDYFSVEDRWTLVPNAAATPPSCTLLIELKVVFSKSTFWKGKIEARAIADNRTKWCTWVERAQQHLAELRAAPVEPVDVPAVTDVGPGAERDVRSLAHQSSADSRVEAVDEHDTRARRSPQQLAAQSSNASTRSNKRRSSRATSSSSHRSRSAAAAPVPSFLLYLRVFPWLLVLVLLFLVIRMQSSLATIEHALVAATAKMSAIEHRLASLPAACSAPP